MAAALDRWRRSSAPATERLTAGLRPERLRLVPAANRHLAAQVSHTEALGNEQLLTCRLLEGSHLVLVRTGPEETVTAGQRVHLEVDPQGWRLFDGAGDALLAPPHPADRGLSREGSSNSGWSSGQRAAGGSDLNPNRLINSGAPISTKSLLGEITAWRDHCL